jgi:hypothetical protein
MRGGSAAKSACSPASRDGVAGFGCSANTSRAGLCYAALYVFHQSAVKLVGSRSKEPDRVWTAPRDAPIFRAMPKTLVSTLDSEVIIAVQLGTAIYTVKEYPPGAQTLMIAMGGCLALAKWIIPHWWRCYVVRLMEKPVWRPT